MAQVLAAGFACRPSPHAVPDAGPPGCSSLVVIADGPTTLRAHVGDSFALSALVVREGTGSLAQTPVSWSARKPGTSSPPAPYVSTTDSAGVATASISITAAADLEVTATVADVLLPATWTIQVEPQALSLSVVACPGGTIAGDSSVAFVDVAGGASAALCVQVTSGLGADAGAVEGAAVTYSIPESSGVTLDPPTGVVTTDPTGIARVSVTPVGAPLGSLVQAALGAQSVFFLVSAPGPETDISVSCTDASVGCPPGYACADTGTCVTLASMACGSCGQGFVCNAGMTGCVAQTPECMTDGDCPGESCEGGFCYPTAAAVPDVSGHWYTEHEIDLSGALPAWVQTGVAALQQIGPSIVQGLALPAADDDLLMSAVTRFFPSWFPRFIQILDNLGTILSTLHVLGEMTVTLPGDPHIFAATESWTDLIYYDLSRCEAPAPAPGSHPDCARVDIPVEALDRANLSVNVPGFAGTVSVSASGAVLSTATRSVELSPGGLALFVFTRLVADATGGEATTPMTVNAALSEAFDCADFSTLTQDLACLNATSVCQDALTAGTAPWTMALSNPVLNVQELSFSGQATVQPDPSNASNPAVALGVPDFATQTPADGAWSGEILGGAAITGRWHASRTPIDPQ